MAKQTKQIRILSEGRFFKLMEKVKKQFSERRGIDLTDDEACEDIASAVEEKKIYH